MYQFTERLLKKIIITLKRQIQKLKNDKILLLINFKG